MSRFPKNSLQSEQTWAPEPSRKQTPKPSRQVEQLLAQHTIKETNLEYQQLLIREKELEIEMGELQNELRSLQKSKRKADKGAE